MSATSSHDNTGRWEEEIQRRRGLWVQVPNALIDGPALRSIRHADTFRVYLIFLSKAPLPPTKKQRKRDRVRRTILANHNLVFPFAEAEYRGITRRSFARAIRELVALGLIDVMKRGEGMTKGDFSTYRLSERWRRFGEADFECKQHPKRKIPHDEKTGRWIKIRSRKTPPPEFALGVKSDPSTRVPSDPGEAPIRVNSDPYKSRFQDVYKGQSRPQSEDLTKGVQTSIRWRPALSEVRENVVEVLSRRPDPRADNRRFVALIVNQLNGVRKGRLNAVRFLRDLQEKHGMDDWTTDLLFAIAAIEIPTIEEAVN